MVKEMSMVDQVVALTNARKDMANTISHLGKQRGLNEDGSTKCPNVVFGNGYGLSVSTTDKELVPMLVEVAHKYYTEKLESVDNLLEQAEERLKGL